MLRNIINDIKGQLLTVNERPEVTQLLTQDRHEKFTEFLAQVKKQIKLVVNMERYFRLWFLFCMYAIVTHICSIPFWLFHTFLVMPIIQLTNVKTRNVGSETIITVLGAYLFTRNWLYFDISYLYHSFRGQTSLKYYGLMFAFEVSEKLLTMLGKPILTALPTLKANSLFIVFCSFLYVILHAYSVYLEYIIFIVVVNSQIQSFIIYIFVINLTKMKSTAFKKFDQESYCAQINYDMKDRMQKFVYLILFALSESNRSVDKFYFKIFCILFVGTFIEWIKHTTMLNIGDKPINLEEICKKTLAESGSKHSSLLIKCVKMDFNLLPLAVFVCKMLHKAYYIGIANIDLHNLGMTCLAFIIYVSLVPLLVLIRHLWVSLRACLRTEDDLMEESVEGM